MYTTTDEKGILNNYATEPKIYIADYPSTEQQRQYIMQAAIGVLLVAIAVFTAFGVSY